MSETTMPWFRFYSEVIGDRKFSRAARMCGVSMMEIMGAWTLILCAANDSPVRGALYVTLLERYSNDDVADLLCCSSEQATAIVDAFVQMEMLEVIDGAYCIKNWEKRQYTSDNSTERVRKHREKQSCNGDVTPDVTPMKRYSNVTVTPSDTDTESDKYIAEEEGEPPPNVFRAYEQEIGPLTPAIADALRDLEAEHPPNWVIAAMKIAAVNQKRSLAYFRAILDRWRTDGYGAELKRNGARASPGKPAEPAGYAGIREWLSRSGEQLDDNSS